MTRKSTHRIRRDREMIVMFHKLYDLCLQTTAGRCREAYDLAERIQKKKHGSRAYKNYNSFKNSRKGFLASLRAEKLAGRGDDPSA